MQQIKSRLSASEVWALAAVKQQQMILSAGTRLLDSLRGGGFCRLPVITHYRIAPSSTSTTPYTTLAESP